MMKNNKKTTKSKWPPYTRWYDKLPKDKKLDTLKEQCRELKIDNIIW